MRLRCDAAITSGLGAARCVYLLGGVVKGPDADRDERNRGVRFASLSA